MTPEQSVVPQNDDNTHKTMCPYCNEVEAKKNRKTCCRPKCISKQRELGGRNSAKKNWRWNAMSGAKKTLTNKE